ncbi:hypothetical protein, partial [Pseudomonas aeruginosa]
VMADQAFAARFEALERGYVVLAGFLQQQGVIDTQRLQAEMRHHADLLQVQPEVAHFLEHLADQVLREYLLQAGKTPGQVERILREQHQD